MSEMELWWGLDSSIASSDWWKEISAEDIVRVNESLWEARKYRGRIASSVAGNTKVAEFIKYLFLVIESDEFRETIDCFTVRNPLGDASFLSKTFVACMLPLYPEKADELWLDKEFTLDYHFLVNFQNYLLYVQWVFAHDAESWKADEKKLKEFLKIIIQLWNIAMTEDESLDVMKVLWN